MHHVNGELLLIPALINDGEIEGQPIPVRVPAMQTGVQIYISTTFLFMHG